MKIMQTVLLNIVWKSLKLMYSMWFFLCEWYQNFPFYLVLVIKLLLKLCIISQDSSLTGDRKDAK